MRRTPAAGTTRSSLSLAGTLLAVVSLACTSPAPAQLPALADLPPGWSMLRPGGETTCALGTEYAFFARAGDPARLVVYLQGGGACWRGENCDPDSRPTYAPDVDESDDPGTRPVGIFDLDNPDNPVADWSMVMVPYCTGDVHLGDREASYELTPPERPPRRITIRHRGFVNARAVLEWVFANVRRPREILVTGSSAGSIPSPFYAMLLAQHYPDARVVALGDGSGSYRRTRPSQSETLRAWGTLDVVRRFEGFAGYDEQSFGFEDLYIVAARQVPRLRLLQYDTAHDAVQAFYLRLGEQGQAEEPDVRALIERNRADIRAEVPGFRSYLAGGPEHTILWRSALYDTEADGVLFRDWFAAALAGRPVREVVCRDCAFPGLHYEPADGEILAYLRRALATPEKWRRPAGNTCVPEPPWSLPCALRLAGQVHGDPRRIHRALALEIGLRRPDLPARGDRLRAFNDDDATDFGRLRELLDAVGERIARHAHEAG